MKKNTVNTDLISKIMRSVKSKNTSTEILVRSFLRSQGYYYRLHVKNLPGTPDIVIRKLKKIIFVNGCFWHGHQCNKGMLPKSNVGFWKSKIDKNIERDNRVNTELEILGWKTFIVWQCELKKPEKVFKQLLDFLTM